MMIVRIGHGRTVMVLFGFLGVARVFGVVSILLRTTTFQASVFVYLSPTKTIGFGCFFHNEGNS